MDVGETRLHRAANVKRKLIHDTNKWLWELLTKKKPVGSIGTSKIILSVAIKYFYIALYGKKNKNSYWVSKPRCGGSFWDKGEFPSGQWGQTVNLLLLSASMVRIHPLPPADLSIIVIKLLRFSIKRKNVSIELIDYASVDYQRR